MADQIQKSYTLTGTWTQLEPQDALRRGVIFQNQSANSPNNLLIAQGEPTSDFAAIELSPSGDLYEDILPPSGAIWGKSTGGATLTLALKY